MSDAVTSVAAEMVATGNALKTGGDEELHSATELVKVAADSQTAEVQAYASKHTSDVQALDQSVVAYGSDVSLINISVPPLVAHADFPHSADFTRTPASAAVLEAAGVPQMTAEELAIVEGGYEQEMEDSSPAEAPDVGDRDQATFAAQRVSMDNGAEAAAENLNPDRVGKAPARSVGERSASNAAKRSVGMPLGTLNA